MNWPQNPLAYLAAKWWWDDYNRAPASGWEIGIRLAELAAMVLLVALVWNLWR